VLKFGHFGRYIANILDVFECGAGEGRRRSVGSIVWKMKYYMKSRRKGTSYTIKQRKAN
jgi:hypothetical protein